MGLNLHLAPRRESRTTAIGRWRQRSPKGWSFVRHVALLSGGTALGQAINVLLVPAITRLYLPLDMGHLALFTSFLNIGSIIVSLRYELGVVSARTEREAAVLLLTAGALTLPLSLALTGALYILIRHSVLGYGNLPVYATVLMLPGLALTGAFGTLRYWLIRRERYGLISQATVVQQGVRAISQAGLGLLGSTTAGLLAGELAGRSCAMWRMVREAVPILRAQVVGLQTSEVRAVLNRNRKFPLFSMPSTLIDNTCANLLIPLIVLLYGADAGGQFALVSRMMAVPLTLVGASVADVFHSRAAIHVRDNPRSCASLFWSTSAGLLAIGILPSVLLFFFGEPLFAMVFGQRWALAGTFTALMTPWLLAQFIVSPLSRLLDVLRGQEFKLIYDIFVLAGITVVFWLAKHHAWSVLVTLRWLTIVNTFGYMLYYGVLVWLLSKSARQESPAEQLCRKIG